MRLKISRVSSTFQFNWSVTFRLLVFALIMGIHALNAGEAQSRIPSPNSIGKTSLLCAHAHNDYEHTKPLFDALAQGFGSVEPDIWLVDGKLLVAHNLEDVKPERTLQALYLDPLRELLRRNGGRVFSNEATFTLLIDVKSAAEPTYAALHALLQDYKDLLTTYTATNVITNSLTIIISGNRATDIVAAQPLRYVAIDGRLAEMSTNLPPRLVPLISENWSQHFKWRGIGTFPEDQKHQLQEMVERVHREGRRIRFWAIPDTMVGWRELQSAGVDVIGTDDLAGLAKFLHSYNP